jgi:hypothetical protein
VASNLRLVPRLVSVLGLTSVLATLGGCICQPPPSAHFSKQTHPVAKTAKVAVAAKMQSSPPARPNEHADRTIDKAKAAVAAMMENPGSAEFGGIKRGVKNLRGERLDTVCGHVRGKSASGGDTGDMPFLYIVHHNEAHLVDGSSPVADTLYQVLCI